MNFTTGNHVRRLIAMRDAIGELRLALKAHGRGSALIQPRFGTKGDSVTLSTMGAILPDRGSVRREGVFDA